MIWMSGMRIYQETKFHPVASRGTWNPEIVQKSSTLLTTFGLILHTVNVYDISTSIFSVLCFPQLKLCTRTKQM